MRSRRLSCTLLALLLTAAACGASGDDPAIELEGSGGAGAHAVELAQANGGLDIDPDAIIAASELEIEGIRTELETILADRDAACAAKSPDDVINQPSVDFVNHTFVGPELTCAVLTGAQMENAVLDGVDVSGADLSGVDLRNARLRITAVGANFSGADLTGADLRGSDLTGADFTGATLTDARMTDFVGGGLTGANLSDSTIGCERLDAYPLVDLTGVTVTADCGEGSGFEVVIMAGSLAGAEAPGLDFEHVQLVAVDLRLANLAGISLADYGNVPVGVAFAGADLSGADLSENVFDRAVFVGADLAGADFESSAISNSYFNGADMTRTNMASVESDTNVYRGAVMSGTDFTDASLSWDDLSLVAFDNVVVTRTVTTAIVCDGAPGEENGNSVRNFGLCLSDNSWIF